VRWGEGAAGVRWGWRRERVQQICFRLVAGLAVPFQALRTHMGTWLARGVRRDLL
jgi:hypothetical protein